MADNVPPFSTDEQIDLIRSGDKCLEIVGFVDELEGQKIVGTKIKHKLLKFVLNNGMNRRVQCLLWNDQIAIYELQLNLNEIIHIDGASARAMSTNYLKGEMLSPIEINIQNNTELTFYGSYVVPETINISDVTFETIGAATGLVRLFGYVKTVFRHLTNGRTASGSVCDGTHKINIMVQNYVKVDEIVKGMPIRVTGTIVSGIDRTIQLQCKDNSCLETGEDMEHLNLLSVMQSSRSINQIQFDV